MVATALTGWVVLEAGVAALSCIQSEALYPLYKNMHHLRSPRGNRSRRRARATVFHPSRDASEGESEGDEGG